MGARLGANILRSQSRQNETRSRSNMVVETGGREGARLQSAPRAGGRAGGVCAVGRSGGAG